VGAVYSSMTSAINARCWKGRPDSGQENSA
jgi:hypothetical protein